jgi:hypothetical protein
VARPTISGEPEFPYEITTQVKKKKKKEMPFSWQMTAVK